VNAQLFSTSSELKLKLPATTVSSLEKSFAAGASLAFAYPNAKTATTDKIIFFIFVLFKVN